MTEFVLLPGVWNGPWAYADVAAHLVGAGHPAHAAGWLGAGDCSGPAGVNLRTDADQVFRL
jgi:hypothetical protein